MCLDFPYNYFELRQLAGGLKPLSSHSSLGTDFASQSHSFQGLKGLQGGAGTNEEGRIDYRSQWERMRVGIGRRAAVGGADMEAARMLTFISTRWLRSSVTGGMESELSVK